MTYYEWLGNREAVDVDFPEDDYQGWWMVEGRPVPNWDENLLATYHGESPIEFDFGIADNSWVVFSSRMRRLLETTVPGLVQFLPFRLLVEDTGREVNSYCVGQILTLIDCLDRRRTRVRNNWKPINNWGDFGVYPPTVLNKALIGNANLFRIKGQCHSIVAREDLKEAIEQAGFKDQRFDLLDVT
jgi:hypothetical protein